MSNSANDSYEGLLNRADKIQHEISIFLAGDIFSVPLELSAALTSASQKQWEDLNFLRQSLELSCPELGLEAVEKRPSEC